MILFARPVDPKTFTITSS